MKKLLTGIAIGYSIGAVVALAAAMPEITDPDKRPNRQTSLKEQAQDVGLIVMAMALWPSLFHHVLTKES